LKTEVVKSNLKKLVNKDLDYCNIPGCNIGMFDKNEIKSIFSVGENNIETGSLFDENTMFPLGSCVKSIVTIAIGILVDGQTLFIVYGYVDIYLLDGQLRLRYYSLDVILQNVSEETFIAIPSDNYVSVRNMLGYNNSILITFYKSKTEDVFKFLYHHETGLKDIEFKLVNKEL